MVTLNACPFGPPERDQTFGVGGQMVAIWSKYEVSKGHALILPKRHVERFEDMTGAESREMFEMVDDVMRSIRLEHNPDGFNLGMNLGEAAGQTVKHVHFHVIPRYKGDVEDPRGGVRNVIPSKGNYLK